MDSGYFVDAEFLASNLLSDYAIYDEQVLFRRSCIQKEVDQSSIPHFADFVFAESYFEHIPGILQDLYLLDGDPMDCGRVLPVFLHLHFDHVDARLPPHKLQKAIKDQVSGFNNYCVD